MELCGGNAMLFYGVSTILSFNALVILLLQVRFSRWQPWDQYLVLDTDYETFSGKENENKTQN